MATGDALEVVELAKDFGGLRALNGVSFRVRAGERVTIIGPNGAGKTTLFNLISGALMPTRGAIFLLGAEVTRWPAHRRARKGLARSFQITNLFRGLTVFESATLTAIRRDHQDYTFYRAWAGQTRFAEQVRGPLREWGFGHKQDVLIRHLSYGEQRRLEICLTLMMNPRVLLLDEPTAGLSSQERAEFVSLLRQLPADLTCLIVEHDLTVGFAVAQRVIGMHQGRIAVEGTPDQMEQNATLEAIYFSRE